MLQKYFPYIGGGVLIILLAMLFTGGDDAPTEQESAQAEVQAVTSETSTEDAPAESESAEGSAESSTETDTDTADASETEAVSSDADTTESTADAATDTAATDTTSDEATADTTTAESGSDATADSSADASSSTETAALDPEAAAKAAGVDAWCGESCQAIRIERGIVGPTELPAAPEAPPAPAPAPTPVAAPEPPTETDYDSTCGEACMAIRAKRSGGEVAAADSTATEAVDEAAAKAAGADAWCGESCQAIRMERGIVGPTELPAAPEPAPAPPAPDPTPVAAPEAPAETDYDKTCGEACMAIRAKRAGGEIATSDSAEPAADDADSDSAEAEAATDAETVDTDTDTADADNDKWCGESCQAIRAKRAGGDVASSDAADTDTANADNDKWCGESCQAIRAKRAGGDTETAKAGSEETSDSKTAAAEEPTGPSPDFTLSSGSRALGRAFGMTLAVLPKVEDASTAEEALPLLDSTSAELDSFMADFNVAPDSMKSAFKKLSNRYRFKLKATADSVLSREGVNKVIGPTVSKIVDTANAIAK